MKTLKSVSQVALFLKREVEGPQLILPGTEPVTVFHEHGRV